MLVENSALTQICAVLLTFVILTGCDSKKSERSESEKIFDDQLATISSGAAILHEEIHLHRDLNCQMVDKLNPVPAASGNKKNKTILDLSFRNAETLCTIYVEALPFSEPVFEEILKSKQMPSRVYAFSVFTEGEGDTFSKDEIGLFLNLSECRKLENYARDKGLGTKTCYEWQDKPVD